MKSEYVNVILLTATRTLYHALRLWWIKKRPFALARTPSGSHRQPSVADHSSRRQRAQPPPPHTPQRARAHTHQQGGALRVGAGRTKWRTVRARVIGVAYVRTLSTWQEFLHFSVDTVVVLWVTRPVRLACRYILSTKSRWHSARSECVKWLANLKQR